MEAILLKVREETPTKKLKVRGSHKKNGLLFCFGFLMMVHLRDMAVLLMPCIIYEEFTRSQKNVV